MILTYKVGRLCPVIAGGVCVGSLYWTCVTYGAVTVMQVREFSVHNAMVHHDLMFCKHNVFFSLIQWFIMIDGVMFLRWPDTLTV